MVSVPSKKEESVSGAWKRSGLERYQEREVRNGFAFAVRRSDRARWITALGQDRDQDGQKTDRTSKSQGQGSWELGRMETRCPSLGTGAAAK